jgi:putative DNA primase/helicase
MSGFAPIDEPNEPNHKREPLVQLKPILVNLDDVVSKPIAWLWKDRIAIGKLTMISGDPCLGKSTFTMDIAARVSNGAPWADIPEVEREAGGVVILSAEDDLADTIKPRLQAAGANTKRIVALKAVQRSCDDVVYETMFSLATDMLQLRQAVEKVDDCRLIVIDPISAYLGGTDSHKDAQVRGVLAPLSELASDLGVAVITVAHLNKSNGGKAIYRTGGSIAFVAAVRSAFVVVKDLKDPNRRLVLPTKNNLAPSDIGGLAYTVESATVPVEGGEVSAPLVMIEPDPVVGCADDYMVEPNVEEDDQDDATEWLKDTLSDGAVGSTELFRMASLQGFNKNIIRRAYNRLGGKPKKSGFDGGWNWELPFLSQ